MTLDPIPPATVYLVSKEFGPASVGGIGRVVDGMAADVFGDRARVVVPRYTFLVERGTPMAPYCDVTVRVDGRPRRVPVHRDGRVFYVGGPLPRAAEDDYLEIQHPVPAAEEIYTALPWFDQVAFEVAAAKLLAAERRRGPAVAVLHDYDAAALAPLLAGVMKSALVLHCYAASFGANATIERATLRRFDDLPREAYEPLAGDDGLVHCAALGLAASDRVVMAGTRAFRDLVDGRYDAGMAHRETLRPLIARRARAGELLPISSGISLACGPSPFGHAHADIRFDSASVRGAKSSAKRRLALDEATPLVLFVGRFALTKGIDRIPAAAAACRAHGAALAVVGRHDVPEDSRRWLAALRAAYPEVLVVDDEATQERTGLVLRTAADLLLVPSRVELLGIVALEGLLFACRGITTGVGGLSEMFHDRNAFFFEGDDPASLARAVADAVAMLGRARRDPVSDELGLRALVDEARSWQWSGAPGAKYRALVDGLASEPLASRTVA